MPNWSVRRNLAEDISINSTAVRAHRSAQWRKRGAKVQGIGRSRGGPTTKIHALTDGCGRAVALLLTPGTAPTSPPHRAFWPPIGTEAADRRQGIRRQQPAELPAGAADRGRHPVHGLAQAADPLRPPNLSGSVQNSFALSLTQRRLRRLRSSPRGAAPCSCSSGLTTGYRRCAGAWLRRFPWSPGRGSP